MLWRDVHSVSEKKGQSCGIAVRGHEMFRTGIYAVNKAPVRNGVLPAILTSSMPSMA